LIDPEGKAAAVRRWYYYRGSYCKATEVEERTGRRLVLRRIATLGSHLVRNVGRKARVIDSASLPNLSPARL
jgi:hypothetical protein